MRFSDVTLRLPEWMEDVLPDSAATYPSDEDRMALVIELARQNVRRGTGGPFAAAIFDAASHNLVAPGVNLVASQRCSVAHAETLAIMLAQRRLGTHDLAAPGLPPHELATSAAPCAMCLGAIPWSGVRRVVCAAREEDVRAVGFDEGDKPPEWAKTLEARGISVLQDVRRADAVEVLREYARGGGVVYNSRRAS
jgi:tRNA(Arg) A34 adenosine deaminase TadA